MTRGFRRQRGRRERLLSEAPHPVPQRVFRKFVWSSNNIDYDIGIDRRFHPRLFSPFGTGPRNASRAASPDFQGALRLHRPRNWEKKLFSTAFETIKVEFLSWIFNLTPGRRARAFRIWIGTVICPFEEIVVVILYFAGKAIKIKPFTGRGQRPQGFVSNAAVVLRRYCFPA